MTLPLPSGRGFLLPATTLCLINTLLLDRSEPPMSEVMGFLLRHSP